MEPIYNSVVKFLGNDQQFTIPIFQRNYNWKEEQCQELFDDIIAVGDSSDETYFLGTIVHIDGEYKTIPTYRVFDGQQRLTTLTLLLAALANFLKKNKVEGLEITSKNIINKYLINRDEEKDLKYRIKLNAPDNETLQYIIDYTISEQEMNLSECKGSENIINNFSYFLKRINKENAKILFEGFKKLYLIAIKLGHSDNPQLIFASLNYKGLILSAPDLIRNYVLMGLTPNEQDEIYENYWFKMEQTFNNIKGYTFKNFLKDYLTTKENKIPSLKNLYKEFVRYSYDFFSKYPSKNNFEKMKELVKDIFKYFKYAEKIFDSKENEFDLKLSFENIYRLQIDVITPFFLQLYDDYENKLLQKDEFLNIINITESYLFRRKVCNLNNQSLKTIFSKIYKQIDKEHYYDSYQELLYEYDGETRFPKNREFGEAFIKIDIYKKRYLCKYALDRLENFGHEKELTNTDKLTIEHIMPQKQPLSDEWQKDLGYDWKDIQEKYLHTIGNLTLTGYNQKYSDLPFKKKRDMKNGFEESSIRLNKHLAELDSWNENQITKRASDLRKDAQKIWPYLKTQKYLK